MATNREEVKNNLDQKYDKVIFGKELDHLEYAKFIVSLTGGPAGVASYLASLAADIATETGMNIAIETIFDLLEDRDESTLVGGKTVYGGTATYNHWTIEKYPKINLGQISWGEIKVSRPNTHQIYIAIGRESSQSDSSEGWVWLKNRASGKALDLHSKDISKNGEKIHQWDYGAGKHQQWRLEDAGEGWVWLKNRASGKALDLHSKDIDKNGGKIHQWDYGAGKHQQWRKEGP